MDIDPNFHESERLFFEKLDHIKREDDEQSDEEVKSEPSENKESSSQQAQKPVKFLERPKEVRQQYNVYDDALSEEDDEDGLLNTL